MTSSSSQSQLPPPARLSLQDPELRAEFLRERQNKLGPRGDVAVASSPSCFSPTPPSSPCSSSSSPHHGSRAARLSLSSPELLSELRQSRSRSLRRVPFANGMTTVFSGRGTRGEAPGSAPATQAANHEPSN